jgi:hypothetical protein
MREDADRGEIMEYQLDMSMMFAMHDALRR